MKDLNKNELKKEPEKEEKPISAEYVQEEPEIDDSKYIILGFLTIVLTIIIVFGWGFLAKVDTYVVAPGKVVVKTFKKAIQHKEWATVSKIFVKDGDFVKKGDPLIELEKIAERTNYKVLLAQYYTLLAQRDRLLAEKRGSSTLIFSKEFNSLQDRELKKKIKQSQLELFKTRRQHLLEQLSILNNKKQALMKRLDGLKQVLATKQNLLANYNQEIAEQKALLKKGLVTKYRLLDLQKEKERLEAEIEDLKSQIHETELEIQEYEKQKRLTLKTYYSQVNEDLEKVLSQLSEIRPKIQYAEEKVKKTILRAPVSGQVIGLKVHSPGEVVKPGDTILYIVPHKAQIFILARVLPKDRDKVRVNQLVDLRFPSFISIAANVVEGKLIYISDDTVKEERAPRPFEYYEAHIVLTEKGKKQLKKYGFSLVPGMPAIAYIKVEKVTPIEYLLQPVIILMKTAFHAN